MLSYQHAYHAGNRADLHKHAVWCALLAHLTQKSRGLTILDTHAGRGLYDLAGAEAQKTGEASDGAAAVSLDGSHALGSAVAACRAQYGKMAYPGSPLLSLHFARPQDQVILMEKHPQEGAALKTVMRGKKAVVHLRDGYEGALALAPPTPRKGLVMIDPSYEVKTEYQDVALFLPTLIDKWPEASVLLWYPILAAKRHEAMLDTLSPMQPCRHEVLFTEDSLLRMKGSGLVLISPPYGGEGAIDAALAPFDHLWTSCRQSPS